MSLTPGPSPSGRGEEALTLRPAQGNAPGPSPSGRGDLFPVRD